ncbi:MAG: UDP-N-acetylmuramoyl-L-alanyl-D-glutamate--2,6-diaminopimelate ligase [Clostridia bacterium]|nr:UDP-N-acetylmuramoyl-L-alanyl-D-glutamate--2,6-diaminopimelate ligase [Clostridia bacterium]
MKVSKLFEQIPVLQWHCDPELEVSGVCFDSRKAAPGCAFVAVRGFATDGHRFIPAALEKGAGLIIAEEAPACDVPYVLVENSRRVLAQVSANFYDHPEKKLRMIGVTGTNGKTTTTHLLKTVLEHAGHKCALIGTNGVKIGDTHIPGQRTTPESCDLFRLLDEMVQAGCSHVLMEVSSHSLVLDRVYGITFDVAAFTNLTQDHLDFHGDMEQYYQAKAILFDRCRVGVVNRDDAYGHRLVQERPGKGMITCSMLEDEATLTAKNVLLKPDRVQFEAVCGSDIERVRLGIPGRFSVYNALTVIGCALCLGLDLEEIAAGLACAEGVLGRAEVVPTDTDYTVVIDYAHTPDSMEKILRATRPGTPGRLIALFGAGGDRDATKRPIMGRVGAELADISVITSDNPRSEDPQSIIDQVMEGAKGQKAQLHMVPDRREAIAFAMGMAKAGDTLLLLGKGHETYQEIGGVQLHLDEREEVARILKEQKK